MKVILCMGVYYGIIFLGKQTDAWAYLKLCSTVSWYSSDVSLEAVELWAWYETAGRVELLKSVDQLWNTGHVLPAAPCAEADTSAVVRRVQLTGSICYWGVMNTDIAMEKWITATWLVYHNDNGYAIRAVKMVIIMIFVIRMMIRMQMMEVEIMVMTRVMCDCYDDDDIAQIHGFGKKKKNQHGDNIHIQAHYACMKEKPFA